MKLHESQVREKQTRKQHEHMLMIVSNLYEETIHLKNAENDGACDERILSAISGNERERPGAREPNAAPCGRNS